jgi:hypothetical protein
VFYRKASGLAICRSIEKIIGTPKIPDAPSRAHRFSKFRGTFRGFSTGLSAESGKFPGKRPVFDVFGKSTAFLRLPKLEVDHLFLHG